MTILEWQTCSLGKICQSCTVIFCGTWWGKYIKSTIAFAKMKPHPCMLNECSVIIRKLSTTLHDTLQSSSSNSRRGFPAGLCWKLQDPPSWDGVREERAQASESAAVQGQRLRARVVEGPLLRGGAPPVLWNHFWLKARHETSLTETLY